MGYVVSGMTLIPQTTTNSCWYASARMLIQWRRDHTLSCEVGIVDPSEDSISEAQKKKDSLIYNKEILAFAKRLGLEPVPPMSPTESALETWLRRFGPLWVNGKTHIVVITGIQPGQVYVYYLGPKDRH